MRLPQKSVIITAAASGMGRAGAKLFAAEGANVVAIDIDRENLVSLEKEVCSDGGKLSIVHADLSIPADAKQAVEHAVTALDGSVDILWSHAGINGPTDVENLDLAFYEKTVSLNITSALLAIGVVSPIMRAKGRGSILVTSSIAGIVGSIQNPIYSMTKFALIGFVKSHALRLAPDNIRINAICPGPVNSPMLRDLIENTEGGRDFERKRLASIPMGRFAEPIELAEAALFLVSDAASYITGVALPVDGGLVAQ